MNILFTGAIRKPGQYWLSPSIQVPPPDDSGRSLRKIFADDDSLIKLYDTNALNKEAALKVTKEELTIVINELNELNKRFFPPITPIETIQKVLNIITNTLEPEETLDPLDKALQPARRNALYTVESTFIKLHVVDRIPLVFIQEVLDQMKSS